jgi:predicted ArsR family transcriptional regulator
MACDRIDTDSRFQTSSIKGVRMPRRRKGVIGNVLGFVAQARASASKALQNLRKEITATRKHLEKLIAEERSFRLDLFGTGGPGRPRSTGRRRRVGRPAGRKARATKPRRKGPPKAEAFFKKLPKAFTMDQVRKVAGKASAISLAQWSRAKKIKKTASGYEKVAA